MRTETDFIGPVEVSDKALYGIHSVRAVHNFPDITPFHTEWYRALGIVKRACLLTYRKYIDAVRSKFPGTVSEMQYMDDEVLDALIRAAGEVEEGMHEEHFIVPAIQGGAGTSINMNINEILANRALLLLGGQPGEYHRVDPIEHANVCQSTNDVIPTSLKVALLKLFRNLENTINALRLSFEEKEKESREYLRIGYTQMQEAVPSSYGRLFSTYCDALSRDWWRVSKCAERIKTVNLGGSAIGTGITVPRFYLAHVVHTLQEISGLPLTRAENLQDATCNLDALVEVHAMIKAHAVNLEKMVSDLRLLASDLPAEKEVHIPRLQVGSSIMPGKVNPVVPEFVISATHQVYSNDLLVSSLCAQGCLDLNAYIPIIGHTMIGSLKLLIACDVTLRSNLVSDLKVDACLAEGHLLYSPAISTALLPYIGYKQSTRLAEEMKANHITIVEANKRLGIIPEEKLIWIIEPRNLLKEGFSLQDVMKSHGEGQGK